MNGVNGNAWYEIKNKWYALAVLEGDHEAGKFFPKKIEQLLQDDVSSFYSSTCPVRDGSFLLGKSMLVHLFARIAQVFDTAIDGLIGLVFGIGIIILSPGAETPIEAMKSGFIFVLGGVYALSIGLAVDSALAVTSSLEGIYEATRVFFSRSSIGAINNNNEILPTS